MGSEQAIRLPMTGPNMLAALEGRKWITRRVMRTQPPDGWTPETVGWYAPTKIDRHGEEYPGEEVFGASDADWGLPCPYGAPGDPLVLTETWRPRDVRNIRRAQKALIEYRADGKTLWLAIPDLDAREKIERALKHGRWMPPMFMQVWASRAPTVNEDIRVERVQEITEWDAFAEGLRLPPEEECPPRMIDIFGWWKLPWRELWDSINAKRGYSFASNPWVWVVSFKKVEAP